MIHDKNCFHSMQQIICLCPYQARCCEIHFQALAESSIGSTSKIQHDLSSLILDKSNSAGFLLNHLLILQFSLSAPAVLYPGLQVHLYCLLKASVSSQIPWFPHLGPSRELRHTMSSSGQPLTWFSPLEYWPV